MSLKTFPTLDFERGLAATGTRYLISLDEVGRGAIAGPVAVGAILVDLLDQDTLSKAPAGIADSKLLNEAARESLFDPIRTWQPRQSVGMVYAREIDSHGIIWALAKAAENAIGDLISEPEDRRNLVSSGVTVLLDGSHNWLGGASFGIPVVVRPKADRDCLTVAAASILAKVIRDRHMIALAKEHPSYGLEGHKGYASAQHIAAIREHGPAEIHRHNWLAKILDEERLKFSE